MRRYLISLVFIALFVGCSSTSSQNEVSAMDDNYFQRDGALKFASATYKKPISLNSTETGAWGALGENQKDAEFLLAKGILPSDSSCNCSTVKVCNGQAPDKIFASRLAPSKRVMVKNNPNHNRYYFLRSCDTSPEQLAFFIWGDKSKANLLLNSVGGQNNWQPGTQITYKSPKNSSDTFKSFYNDHQGTKKYYVVKGGDTLTKIAYQAYGDIRSWKEIALENNLDSPDSLEKGMKLVLNYKE